MKKINLVITGCLGRMGQQLVRSSRSAKNFKLVSITENRIINKKVSGLRPQLNSESAFKKANIIIDFTVPKCTLEVLKIASKLKKRVVIGTTGFSKKEENLIKKYSKKIPILKAGNNGYMMMTDEWFDEYTYEVVVDKKYLRKKIFKYLDLEPITLAPWDPMGALAK